MIVAQMLDKLLLHGTPLASAQFYQLLVPNLSSLPSLGCCSFFFFFHLSVNLQFLDKMLVSFMMNVHHWFQCCISSSRMQNKCSLQTGRCKKKSWPLFSRFNWYISRLQEYGKVMDSEKLPALVNVTVNVHQLAWVHKWLHKITKLHFRSQSNDLFSCFLPMKLGSLNMSKVSFKELKR